MQNTAGLRRFPPNQRLDQMTCHPDTDTTFQELRSALTSEAPLLMSGKDEYLHTVKILYERLTEAGSIQDLAPEATRAELCERLMDVIMRSDFFSLPEVRDFPAFRSLHPAADWHVSGHNQIHHDFPDSRFEKRCRVKGIQAGHLCKVHKLRDVFVEQKAYDPAHRRRQERVGRRHSGPSEDLLDGVQAVVSGMTAYRRWWTLIII